MTIRTTSADAEHDALVRELADRFQKMGMYVKADHIKHLNGSPNEINGHIPDVEAITNGKRILAEAETADTISHPDTRLQFLAFSNIGNSEFRVMVPRGFIPTMQRQAAMWGIKVDRYWIPEA